MATGTINLVGMHIVGPIGLTQRFDIMALKTCRSLNGAFGDRFSTKSDKLGCFPRMACLFAVAVLAGYIQCIISMKPKHFSVALVAHDALFVLVYF